MSVRFAWPSFIGPWSVVVEDLRTDGRHRPGCVDVPRRRVRLDQAGDWESATFHVTASTSEETPLGLASVRAFAILSSPRTNTRIPFALTATDSGESRFNGTVEVARPAIAGAVDLAVDIGARLGDRPRLVGLGDPWSVIVDASAAPTPPGAPPFETVWLDFKAQEAPFAAQQQPDAYAVLDLTKPALLLNDGIDGLRGLLLAGSARHERRRLREVLGTSIARQATATLMRAAATDIVPLDLDETAPQPPSDGLSTQVCEAVAAEMNTVGSVTEFYERLVAAAHGTPLQNATLWAEIDAAVDRLTGHSAAIARVVEQVKYV